MRNRIVAVILAICMAAVLSSTALADDNPMGRRGKMGEYGKAGHKMDFEDKFYCKAHFLVENALELGLGDEQIEKIKTVKHDVGKNMIKNDAEIEMLGLDIKQALGKDEVNLAEINSLIDRKYVLKAQKAKELAQACVNVKNVLTKDQVKKMKEVWKKCALEAKMDHKCPMQRCE